jgi:molybdate transport repressor ModE-like protein
MHNARWDDIQVFLAVVRAGSLSGAASGLGINHSTAWRRIQALESALEAQLFERSPQGYALTEIGAAMLPHAERVEEEVFALERAVVGSDTLPSGTISVTAPESMLALLTPIFVAFRERHEHIGVDVRLGDRFYDLDRREADVAIRPGLQPPDDAIGRKVCRVAWTVYGPHDLDVEHADALQWIAYGEDLARLAAVQWRKEKHGGAPLMTVNTVPGMRCLLSNGHCRGMLPCFAGDEEPTLRRLLPPIPEAASELWLLVHADLRRNARVRLFVDHAWDSLRELAPIFEGDVETR